MKWVQLAVRVLVSIILLSFVWRNSHWSVSLSLTLVMASIEFSNQNRLSIIKELKNRCDREGKEVTDEAL